METRDSNQNTTDSSISIVRHYISIEAYKIQVILKTLKELSQQDYPSSSPVALTELLIRILSCFFEELRDTYNKVEQGSSEDIIRKVKSINYVIVDIVPSIIEAIKSAEVKAPIASIIQAYEDIGNLIRYGTYLIIYPSWEYNFSFNEIMVNLKNMTKSLDPHNSKAIFTGTPKYAVIISYPKPEEDIILRQALIAHEIGHFINWARGFSAIIFDEKVFDPESLGQIESAIQEHNNNIEIVDDAKDTDVSVDFIVGLVGEIIAAWINELVADYLAICILGPAYLFAFDEVKFSPRYLIVTKLYSSHPPAQLRKKIMADLTKELHLDPIRSSKEFEDLTDKEKEIFEHIYYWVDIVSDFETDNYTEIVAIEDLPPDLVNVTYKTLQRACDKVTQNLRDKILPKIKSEKWFCTSNDIFDSLKLQELLAYRITPTELYSGDNHSPSFAAIMNSGWINFLYEERDYQYFSADIMAINNPGDISKKYDLLHNLIAKAVESSQFKKEFLHRKGDNDEK